MRVNGSSVVLAADEPLFYGVFGHGNPMSLPQPDLVAPTVTLNFKLNSGTRWKVL